MVPPGVRRVLRITLKAEVNDIHIIPLIRTVTGGLPRGCAIDL
jgi:hypothetical protein